MTSGAGGPSPEEPWKGQLVVSIELARTLVDAQFPDLRGTHVFPLGEGWDNAAYVVDGRWVFRFPRHELAAELLRTEGRVLPDLSGRLPVPVPRPRWFGTPSDAYPWPFLGYEMLAGAPAIEAELDDRQRVALAPSLASFLACLHGLDARSVTLVGDRLRRLDVPYRQVQCQAVLQELLGASIIGRSLHDELEAAIAQAPRTSDAEVVISHGDLYCRHLLVDPQGALSGVIDWGDLHLNSRAIDLQVVWSFLPLLGRDAFRRNYPDVGEHVWALARFRAICHSALVARYASSIGDRKLLAESLRALSWAAEG